MKNAIDLTLRDGGTTLWALLALAVMIYSLLFAVAANLLANRKRIANREWAHQRTVSSTLPWQQKHRSLREIEGAYAAYELDRLAWVERRIPFLGVLIGAAPLLGLLGTVSGMLATFGGIASHSRGTPVDSISAGISEALVTTQAGLVIAIPAAFLLALAARLAQNNHSTLQRQLHEELIATRQATSPPSHP